jgi:hypothetical protein
MWLARIVFGCVMVLGFSHVAAAQVALLNNDSIRCGDHGVPPAKELVSSANRPASVTVKITDNTGHSSENIYNVPPKARVFIGCSGMVGGSISQTRLTYQVIKITYN